MRVDVLEVLSLKTKIREINSVPFDEVEWTLKGNPFPVSQHDLDEFKLTGLSNFNYIVTYLNLDPDTLQPR